VAAEVTSTVEAVPDRGGLSRRRTRRLLAALAITQTVGYGVLYYSFSIFLTPMAADLHAGIATVTGALTVAVVLTGLCAVPVGRWIDRHGARHLMSIGSLLGSLAVVAWSQAQNVAELYAAFTVIGIASAMVLYEPAFAVIVQSVDRRRRPSALLSVTIVAGFASSIFLPLAGILNAHLSWRGAVLVLAAAHLVCTVPLHLTVLPRDRIRRQSGLDFRRRPAGYPLAATAFHDSHFWFLTIAFTAQGAAAAVIAVQLVGYLIRLGHRPALAATVAGLLGIMSVTGRLVTTGLRRRYTTSTITSAVFVVQAAAVVSLPVVGQNTAGAVVCVTLFGLGFGVATIARPAMLADRYGASSYASISGAMAVPMNVAKAAAPLAAAILIGTSGSGYGPLMVVVGVLCAGSASILAISTTDTGSAAWVGAAR
jgi:MFS family permease